ncbi:hypothetical protein [Streptomyces sp. NPDC057381]|uniref:hypothetical protein n=1 Tax=Streptomyces sp. NPDC057381 TaxID=3346111 RepID=UPI003637DBCF
MPVLGPREGSWLRVDGERAVVGCERDARLFRRGAEPREPAAGSVVSDLLRVTAAFDARTWARERGCPRGLSGPPGRQ